MKSGPLCKRLFLMALATLVLSACASRVKRIDMYGGPAPAAAAEQTIVITPATTHVNIEGGYIVRFLVGDKDFAWNFNGVGTTPGPLDLREIAPPGVLDHRVLAY